MIGILISTRVPQGEPFSSFISIVFTKTRSFLDWASSCSRCSVMLVPLGQVLVKLGVLLLEFPGILPADPVIFHNAKQGIFVVQGKP